MLDCKQSNIASGATPIGSTDAHPTSTTRAADKNDGVSLKTTSAYARLYESYIASGATPIGSADTHPTTAARTAYKTTNSTAISMLHPNTPIGSILTTSSTVHQQMIDTHYGGYCRFEYLRDSSSPPGTRGATDEGVTPRLLSARVPGACHGWRPTRGPLVDTDMKE